MTEQKFKAYNIWNKNNPCEGIFVISTRVNIAKSIAINSDELYEGYYIDLRVNVCKNADISGLYEGQYDDYEDALIRNFCDVLLNWPECPNCKAKEVNVYFKQDCGFYCDKCKKLQDDEELYNLGCEETYQKYHEDLPNYKKL